VDHAVFAGAVLSEALHGRGLEGARMPVATFHVTDCKSLYDAVCRDTPASEEKRCLIDIRSVKDSLAAGGIRWVPTTEQWADALTKLSEALRQRFADWMGRPVVRLREQGVEAKTDSPV
jgi:hypothetical protein